MRLTMAAPRELTALLQSMAPGTALHQAIQRITQQRNGALIVLGWGPHVEAVCSGGFVLDDTSFIATPTPEEPRQHGQAQLQGLVEAMVELDDIARADTLPKDAFAQEPVGVQLAGYQGEFLVQQLAFQFTFAGGNGTSF